MCHYFFSFADLAGAFFAAGFLAGAFLAGAAFFAVPELARLRIGPIALKDVLEYRRELHLLDEVTVTLETAGRSEDGSRFRLRNTFYRPDGKLAATLTTDGAWLDLERRRIIQPPENLLAATQAMTRTEDFELLASGVKD